MIGHLPLFSLIILLPFTSATSTTNQAETHSHIRNGTMAISNSDYGDGCSDRCSDKVSWKLVIPCQSMCAIIDTTYGECPLSGGNSGCIGSIESAIQDMFGETLGSLVSQVLKSAGLDTVCDIICPATSLTTIIIVVVVVVVFIILLIICCSCCCPCCCCYAMCAGCCGMCGKKQEPGNTYINLQTPSTYNPASMQFVPSGQPYPMGMNQQPYMSPQQTPAYPPGMQYPSSASSYPPSFSMPQQQSNYPQQSPNYPTTATAPPETKQQTATGYPAPIN